MCRSYVSILPKEVALSVMKAVGGLCAVSAILKKIVFCKIQIKCLCVSLEVSLNVVCFI